eukprot:956020_1
MATIFVILGIIYNTCIVLLTANSLLSTNGSYIDTESQLQTGLTQMCAKDPSYCMWLISRECQLPDYKGPIDNTCGVPHASIAEKDNLLIPPYKLYWEKNYNDVKTEWDGTRTLVADTPSKIQISFANVRKAYMTKIKKGMLDYIHDLTGAPRGVLELSNKLIHHVVDKNNNKSTMSILVHGYGGKLLHKLLERGAIHDDMEDVTGDAVPNITVHGDEYDLSSFAAEEGGDVDVPNMPNDVDANEGAKAMGLIAIGIGIGSVLVGKRYELME